MNFFYNQVKTFVSIFILLSFLDIITAQALAETSKDKVIKQPITIAINKTSYPYHAIDKKGDVVGLMPDLWRLWAKKQNVEVKFVVLNWLDTLKQVAEGGVDIHGGLSINDTRREKFLFSKPLFSIYTHFYVNQTLSTVDTLSELKPYTIGVIKGSAHIELLKDHHPELSIKVFNNRHDLYRAALNNEIHVFTGLERLADDFDSYEMLNKRFPAHKVLRNEQSEYGVAVAKGNDNLLSLIDEGFDKITKQERSFIERKWLALDKQKDSLLITFTPNYPPYSGLSLSGEPQGMMIDVWRLWSEQVGINVEFVARDIKSGLSLVKEKKSDVVLFFPQNREVPNDMTFAKPMYVASGQVYLSHKLKKQDGNRFTSLSQLAYEPNQPIFGLWEKSTLKQELIAQYPELNIRYYKSLNAMLNAAESGEISGMAGYVDLLHAKLVTNNLQTLFYRLETPRINAHLAPVIHKDNTKLLEIINQGFSELDINKLISIEDKWLSGPQSDFYYKQQASKAELSTDQKNFIESHNTFNLGVVKGLAPVEFINKEGKFEGINSDFIKLLSERTGLVFKLVVFDTWNEAYNALLTHRVDVVGNMTATASRQDVMLFTESYWDMPWGVMHKYVDGRKSTLKDFYGKEISIVKRNYLIEILKKEHPQIKLKIVNNREEALSDLQQDRVDGYITSIALALHVLRQERNFNLMISIMERVDSDESSFAINTQLPELKDIMNKGLLTITAKEKQAIYDKWLTLEIKTGLDSYVVWKNVAKVGAIVLIILVVILLWNRRLKIEIKYREALENKMKHMATHDELTGLANRVLLKDRLNTAISFHQRQSLKLAVLFIDLDGFKYVNDTHGHDIGDELLQQVALRFQGCVRSSDTVVRFGGDEFVLLLTGLRTTKEASNVAEKVLTVIQKDFELSTTNVSIGCSIGIAIYPDDTDNTVDLMKIADTLMYKVKAAGKNHYMFN